MTAPTEPRLPGGELRVGSLFSGYGGLDMAVRQVLGGRLAWVSDIDPGACAVLAHHHPDVPNLGDVSAIDWTAVDPVDVLCAGFPCQDISNAGRRAGIQGARSGLWSHVADAIGVLRPRLVFLENVSALVVRGLDRVLADLAALGLDAEWTTLRASEVGAPHRRERWFLLAWPAADPASNRRDEGRTEPARLVGRPDAAVRGAGLAAHADGEREQQLQGRVTHSPGRFDDRAAQAVEWGEFGPAVHRWAAVLGRPAPAPVIWSGRYVKQRQRRLARLDRRPVGRRGSLKPEWVLNPSFVSWLMGLPDGYLTQVPGLSRGALLKLCGNGVVPQQGAEAFRYLLAHLSAAAA